MMRFVKLEAICCDIPLRRRPFRKVTWFDRGQRVTMVSERGDLADQTGH